MGCNLDPFLCYKMPQFFNSLRKDGRYLFNFIVELRFLDRHGICLGNVRQSAGLPARGCFPICGQNRIVLKFFFADIFY